MSGRDQASLCRLLCLIKQPDEGRCKTVRTSATLCLFLPLTNTTSATRAPLATRASVQLRHRLCRQDDICERVWRPCRHRTSIDEAHERSACTESASARGMRCRRQCITDSPSISPRIPMNTYIFSRRRTTVTAIELPPTSRCSALACFRNHAVSRPRRARFGETFSD
jgi:hypothetical protein